MLFSFRLFLSSKPSDRQVPGYLENQDAFKEAGIDEIVVYCVNDSAVMGAWEADQGTEGSIVTMFGDPAGTFTKALGMEMTAGTFFFFC